jgi:uncharacterized Zn-binding protein involved in type VI secretion
MGQPAARQNDPVTATDVHIVMVPSPGGPVPTPLPHAFAGKLTSGVSANVMINGLPAATVGSVAVNSSPHLPTPPGTSFSKPPSNQGVVQQGSPTVLINTKSAARMGDAVMTCNDPIDLPAGTITAGSPTVVVG